MILFIKKAKFDNENLKFSLEIYKIINCSKPRIYSIIKNIKRGCKFYKTFKKIHVSNLVLQNFVKYTLNAFASAEHKKLLFIKSFYKNFAIYNISRILKEAL